MSLRLIERCLLLLMLISICFGCIGKRFLSRPAEPRFEEAGWLPGQCSGFDIVLITIDALRYDHLGCSGYQRNTSPEIDHLAGSGIRFTRCYAQAPHTHPSIASVMTGTYPRTHRSIVGSRILSPANRTMAEILQDAGYRTGAFVQNYWLSETFGFNQGFSEFHNLDIELSGNRSMEHILEWLESQESDPRFLWLHFLEPHAGYMPRQQWIKEYLPDYQGDFFTFTNDMLIECRCNGIRLPEEELDYIQACYDSEIRWTDEAIDRIIHFVRDRSGHRPVLFIITSDHGDEFYDHGSLGHDHTLYDELLHVPLILYSPEVWQKPTVISSPVGSIDILPTVLDLLGLDQPAGLEGISLLEFSGSNFPSNRPVIAQRYFFRLASHLISITQYPWKMAVEIPDIDHNDIHNWSIDADRCPALLYNLSSDPDESMDLMASEPEVAAELLDILVAWSHSGTDRNVHEAHDNEQPIDNETRSRLQTLGYLQ